MKTYKMITTLVGRLRSLRTRRCDNSSEFSEALWEAIRALNNLKRFF